MSDPINDNSGGIRVALITALVCFVELPAIAQCSVNEVQRQVAAGTLIVNETTMTEVVCDEQGFEPLDRIFEAGGNHVIRLLESRDVVAAIEQPPVVIEWYEATPNALRRLASREVLSEMQLIRVAKGERRLLRAIWPDGSARSEWVEGKAISFIKPAFPGEVVVLLPSRSVIPERLIVVDRSGESSSTAFGPEGRALLSDLPCGTYTILFEFSETIRWFWPEPVTLCAGERLVLLPEQDIPQFGALHLTQIEGSCADAPVDVAVRLASVLPSDGASGDVSARIYDVSFQACDFVIAGILPGEYDVSVGAVGAPAEAREVLWISPDEIALMELRLPKVVLLGQVYVGESAGANLDVIIVGRDSEWVVKTDEDGEFRAELPHPGTYSAEVRTSLFSPGYATSVDAVRGEQELTLQIPGGVISVTVVGAPTPQPGPAQVALRGQGVSRTAIAPDLTTEFIGLEAGRYELSASIPPDFISDGPSIVSLKENESAKIDLRIREGSRRILQVTDEMGAPVGGARVQVGYTVVREIQAGYFELPSEGDTLLVTAAGWLPICRTLTSSDTNLRLTLLRGTWAVALLAPMEASPSQIFLMGLPGSTCPISLSLLEHQVQRSDAGALVKVHNLVVGEYTATFAGRATRLVVPQTTPVDIR